VSDKLPPNDEAAEWSLLACAVQKPVIIPAIEPYVFYVELARRVLLKMQAAHLQKLDCLNTSEQFEHWLSKSLQPNQFATLMDAVNKLPSPEGWTYWREILYDCYRARELEKLKPKISNISERVARGEPPNDVLLEISRIAGLWQGEQSETLEAYVPRVIDELEESWKTGKYPGVISGFRKLDELTRGFQNNRLYIIAGRPAKGKSTLAMNIALGVATQKEKTQCFFVSLEMSAIEIVKRMFSTLSGVGEYRFKPGIATGEEFKKVVDASLRVKRLPIRITDKLRSLSDVVMACHKAASEGAQLIVIDYLQKIVIPNFRFNRTELVTQISGAMKDIAMSLRVPVICCAQLNRDVEKEDREPTIGDLRDSGSLEQDADFVGLLHRKKEQTDLIVAKNRSGKEGRIALTFKPEIFKFEEIQDRPDAEDIPT